MKLCAMGAEECRGGGGVPIILFYRVCFSGISCILAHIGLCCLFCLAIDSVFLQLPVFFQFLGVLPVANRGVPPGSCALSWGVPRFFCCIRIVHLYFSSCHNPTQSANDHPTYPAPNKRPTSNPDARRSYRIDFRQFRARFVIPTNAAYLAVVRPTLGSLGKWVDSV